MENYYEILQVSSNASKEIIDKAFKTLAKTYHPDANPPEKKEWAEEQFKRINAAYEVISDEEKRKKYDEELKRNEENSARQLEERYQKLQEQHEQLVKELNYLKSRQVGNVAPPSAANSVNNTTNVSSANIQAEINRQVTQSVNKAYHDMYVQQMRARGYKIRYKKSIKDKMKDLLALVLAICVGGILLLILWQFPSFREPIESNEIIQMFIRAFKSM